MASPEQQSTPKFYELPEEERRRRYKEMKEQTEGKNQVVKPSQQLSPEQQPVPQPEINPADPGLDIDAAKKFLEEAYGPEKSSIIVDRSIPAVDVERTETKKAEETKETPITAEVKPTAEELTERIKKEKEMQDARVETAKNELIDLAKNIREAKEKKETKTEHSLYGKAKEVFETATGEDLEKITREKAKTEAEKDGFKIFTPENYRSAKIAEAIKSARQKERSAIIRKRWDMLSVKEKEKYFSEGEDKNDVAVINSARIKFAAELNNKIGEKIAELSKGKKGISISEDVFYELMKEGLKSEDIKKRGFWDFIWDFTRGKIKIPSTDKRGPLTMTKEEIAETEAKVKKYIEEAGKEEIERKIIEGQRMWRAKKQRHMGETIQETAVKYETEKKLKEAPKPPETEIVSNEGKKETPTEAILKKKIRRGVGRERIRQSIRRKYKK